MSSNKSRSISPRTSSSREHRTKSSRISRRHRTFSSMPFSEFPQHTKQPPSEVSFCLGLSNLPIANPSTRPAATPVPRAYPTLPIPFVSPLPNPPFSPSPSPSPSMARTTLAVPTTAVPSAHPSKTRQRFRRLIPPRASPSQRPTTSPFPTPATSSVPTTLEVTEILSIPDRSHRNDHPLERHPHLSTTTRSFPLAVAAALRTKSLRRTHRRPRHPPPQRSLCRTHKAPNHYQVIE